MCFGHGTCTPPPKGTKAKCDCNAGWTGDRCSTKTNTTCPAEQHICKVGSWPCVDQSVICRTVAADCGLGTSEVNDVCHAGKFVYYYGIICVTNGEKSSLKVSGSNCRPNRGRFTLNLREQTITHPLGCTSRYASQCLLSIFLFWLVLRAADSFLNMIIWCMRILV